MTTPPPRRFVNVDQARAKFGASIDCLSQLLFAGDPLADDLVEAFVKLPPGAGQRLLEQAITQGIDSVQDPPPELVALFRELDHVPAWVDKDALERGGELLFRSGWFGGISLATSLLYGYASPCGNKPLVFSGRLDKDTPRRLIETSRFVQATCKPNGLSRFGDGFAITAKVRVMHAHVRRMLLTSGRWSTEDWGLPANQHDMGGTALLFSVIVIDTLTNFGFDFEPEEIHLYMQLWRYSGYLMGVHSEVLPTSQREAKRLAQMIAATEEGADDDSRRLSRAMFASGQNPPRATEEEKRRAERVVRVGQGLIRGALGEHLADQLDVPKHNFRHLFPVVRAVVTRAERLARRAPAFARARLRTRAIASGAAYWDMLIRAAREPISFVPPDRLLGVAAEIASPKTRRGGTLASAVGPR